MALKNYTAERKMVWTRFETQLRRPDWWPGGLAPVQELIEFLIALRDEAQSQGLSMSVYAVHEEEFRLNYERPETDKEYAKRMEQVRKKEKALADRQKKSAKDQEKMERELYRRLHKKYGTEKRKQKERK